MTDTRPSTDTDRLGAFIQSERFRFLGNATDRYLSVLAFAHEGDPEEFAKILEVSGRKRLYFARSYAEIANSGRKHLSPADSRIAILGDNQRGQ